MSKKLLKTVIVEDSQTQRAVLVDFVKKNKNLSFIGDFHNGVTALNSLRSNAIDLILLDIEMPIVSGFDLVDSLENPPQIILVSAKEEYALKAFDYDVTDYLKKPISQDRFNIAIQKAVDSHGYLKPSKESGLYVVISEHLQKKKIPVDQIKWIEALGDYIKIVTIEGNHLILSTMKAFILKLPEKHFVRIHKSFIVNINKIDNWCSTNVEIDGRELPMSRSRKDELEKSLTNS